MENDERFRFARSAENPCVGLAGRASEDGNLDNFKDGGPTWHLIVESNTDHQFWNSV